MKIILDTDLHLTVEKPASSPEVRDPSIYIWNIEENGIAACFGRNDWLILAKGRGGMQPSINVYAFTTEEAALHFWEAATPNFEELTWLQKP